MSQGHWELRVGVGLVGVSPRFVHNSNVSSFIIGDICEFVEINKLSFAIVIDLLSCVIKSSPRIICYLASCESIMFVLFIKIFLPKMSQFVDNCIVNFSVSVSFIIMSPDIVLVLVIILLLKQLC